MYKKNIIKASFLSLALSLTLSACSDNTAKTNSSDSDINYTIGYKSGAGILENKEFKNINLNTQKFVKGYIDAITDITPYISEAQMQQNVDKLKLQMLKSQNQNLTKKFLSVKDSIYNSSLTPKSKVNSPKVVVYEFFDYQCYYCSKMTPEVDAAIKDDKDVQIAFVEFPIFSQQSPASQYAAEVGTAIYKLYGGDMYVKYHDGIFATGEDEGRLKNTTIEKVATNVGAHMSKVSTTIKSQNIAKHIQDTLAMGNNKLGIQGTPAVIITPVKNANLDNTTFINGYTDKSVIDKAIENARK